MASLFTTAEALAAGITYEALRWRTKRGQYQRLEHGVYFKADRPPTQFELRLAKAMRSGKRVGGELAAALHGFDGFDAPQDGRYANVPRENPHETLLAIAATTADIKWEQALEWCLRKHHTTIEDIEVALTTQRRGNGCIRRVLNIRPINAPPTESLLETSMVQLIRTDPHLPMPTRQVEVRNMYDEFVARVDLAWPEHGVFI